MVKRKTMSISDYFETDTNADDTGTSDVVATPSKAKKQPKMGDAAIESTPTKRNSRSKNFKAPNALASARETMSAKALSKNISAKTITETIISMPMEDWCNDPDHERVVFLDNKTGNPKLTLYRKTENAEPMAYIWTDFLRVVQSARDNIGLNTASFLTEEEAAAINLQNNAQIFPTLIPAKGALQSKDNLEASTANTQQNSGKFGGNATATATGADILHTRALSMRKKALALNRQAEAYKKTAETMSDFEMPSEETLLAKAGMSYLGNVLSLSRKEFNRYVTDHEDHLMATAEKLQSEMAGLAHFAHKAEKCLRDQIQLKVAANLKLCGDMEKYKK